MKKTLTIILILTISNTYSQSVNKVFTSDIDNFWIAFDSIQQTNSYSKKLYFINKLYIEKGTKGLKAFMKAENYSDTTYINVIDKFPDFWKSIRRNTFVLKGKTNELDAPIANLKKLYPTLKDAEIYFTIGCLDAAGKISNNMVLMGLEVSAGSLATGAYELKSFDKFASLNIHEYVHTQQKLKSSNQLLNKVIQEGSCDFIAELALDQPMQRQYVSYGNLHFDRLKEQFKKEMFLSDWSNWLYNGPQRGDSTDLGYFMGYEISKSYYQRAKNKAQAIKDIIELDFSNNKDVELFFKRSGFYKKFNKKKLTKEYEKKLPRIVKIGPFKNGAHNVDPKINEFSITFSKEMISGNVSIDYSEKGKDYFPVKKLIRYENNDRICVLSIELQPGKEYEFIITNRRFESKDGYPLKEGKYLVKFRTR
ncbi:hypothetical protein [Niabella hirudinis]|uniref:hypothetical protein n=1 Tax=Niabella hirudinis TaxID=1285929 RepID=UPI003EB9B07F